MNKRFIVREYTAKESGEPIYTVEDTVFGGSFFCWFATREEAQARCDILNIKSKKKCNKLFAGKEQS